MYYLQGHDCPFCFYFCCYLGNFTNYESFVLVSNFPFTFLAGEYVGLTGARLDGAEMLACGLATHFVPSTVYFLSHHACRIICLSFSAQKSNKTQYHSLVRNNTGWKLWPVWVCFCWNEDTRDGYHCCLKFFPCLSN